MLTLIRDQIGSASTPGDIWGRRIGGLGETALLLDWRPPRVEYAFSAKGAAQRAEMNRAFGAVVLAFH
jgi:hypothetical protein